MNQKFVRNSAYLMTSYLILAVVGLVINTYLTTVHGASAFGKFSISIKIYMLASIFASFGTGPSTLKYVAEDLRDSELTNCLLSSLLVSFIMGNIVALMLYSFGGFFQGFFDMTDLETGLKHVSLAIPFFALNKTLFGYFNGSHKIKTLATIQSLRWIMLLILIVSISQITGKFESTLSAFMITEILLLFINLVIVRKALSHGIEIAKIRSWMKRHLDFGVKSALSTSSVELMNSLDVFFVGYMLGASQTGVYSFASDLVKNLILPANIFQINFNPIASKLSSENKLEELKTKAMKILKNTYLLYLPLILFGILAYYVLLRFIEIEEELLSLQIFAILTMGILIMSGFKPLFGMTEMAGFPKDRLWINLSTILTNALLIIVFSSYLGIYGVAIGTTVSYIFSALYLSLSIKKRLGFTLLVNSQK